MASPEPLAYGFSYVRVSTRKQDVENQRLQIGRFAQERGLSLPDENWFVDDAVSGTIPPLERKGFRDMFEVLQGLATEDRLKLPRCVLVYEISRLGRTFWEILEAIRALEEYSPIISTSPKESFLQTQDRSMRQLLLSILAWAAEREREVLVQRTIEGVSRAKEEGKHLGNTPLGYEIVNGRLALNELGRKAYGIYQANQKIKVVMMQRELGLEYKTTWNLLKSIKKFGEPKSHQLT